ncbi:hypothetical protein VNO77_19678 [Canavalia gladiata]|uniref:Uncharacterized protein n=1 Tax=Canavalia gladiata TaxID=3824 RepID=A0AAN9QLN3_CANGL
MYAGTMPRETRKRPSTDRRSPSNSERSSGRNYGGRSQWDGESSCSQYPTVPQFSLEDQQWSRGRGETSDKQLTPKTEVYTTPSQYYRRYERMREASSKGHVMKYGQTQLPVLSHDDPSTFKPMEGIYKKDQASSIERLAVLFFQNYDPSVRKRDTEQIYIEEEDHQGLTQNLQEEIAELTDLITEERAELFRLQRTLSQQESRLAIQVVPHDEFRRKMALMSSFQNNFMTGLLKQGGTRWSTLPSCRSFSTKAKENQRKPNRI